MVCDYNDVLDHRGECKRKHTDCYCKSEYKPVCGVDGQTYFNKCVLNCANMRVDYNGVCLKVEDDCRKMVGERLHGVNIY